MAEVVACDWNGRRLGMLTISAGNHADADHVSWAKARLLALIPERPLRLFVNGAVRMEGQPLYLWRGSGAASAG